MRKISKQILFLFLTLMLVISSIPVNTSYAAADNAAIEAQIIKELETILDTMYLTDLTEQTEDPDLQKSIDATEQTEVLLLQDTNTNTTIESQDLNKPSEITTDEEKAKYEEWKQSLQIAPSMLAIERNIKLLSNEFLSIATNHLGGFTMGTTGGNPNLETDDNKILLYGHPSPSTSFTTIKIDGETVKFEANSSPVVNEVERKITATQTIGDITVNQILTFEQNPNTKRADIVNIKYEMTNNGDVPHEVGSRIMLDTMLGSNDGAPFRVPGLGNVIKEKELVGSQIPQYWEAFDNLDTPNVIANGTLYKSMYERPDKVQFAYWAHITNTLWDYTINEEKDVTWDSAVAVYHNPKTLEPGETRVVNTYYGIGDFAFSDMDPPLSVRVSVPQELAVDTLNGNYLSNPFVITAYVRNIGTEVTRNTKAELKLPANSGLSLLSPAQPTVSIGNLSVGEEKIVSWTVLAASQPNDQTVNYEIGLIADNVETKTIPMSIILPKVTTSNNGTITLNKTQLSMKAGDVETLRATLAGIYGNITWLSRNPDIVSVSQNGLVTAKAGGKTQIIATVGGKTVICEVTITGDVPDLQSIEFTERNVSINVNKTKMLTLSYTPSNAINKRIKSWVSSDPSVVSVLNGRVTGKKKGTAMITAISEHGNKVAQVSVTVVEGEPELNLGDDISFSTTVDGPELNFGGKKFNLFTLPVGIDLRFKNSVKLTYDPSADSYIASFGDLEPPTGTDDKNPNGTLTDEAKKLRKDTYQRVKSLMGMVGKKTNREFYNNYRKLIAKKSPFSVNGDKSTFGYVEFTNTRNGYQLAKGEVAVLFDAGVNLRFPLPPVPAAYVKFSVSGSLQTGLRLQLKEYGDLSGGVYIYGSAKASLKPSLGVGADIGIAGLEGGLEGNLNTNINFPFNKKFSARDDFSMNLTASIYLKYRLFLFVNGKNTWKLTSWKVYPNQTRATGFSAFSIDPSDSELMPRDYINQPSNFTANGKVQLARTFDALTHEGNTKIKENVYPYGTPQLVTFSDGRQLLVWVDDDRERAAENRTALYYSIFTDSWSNPQQIDNDGTADFSPSLVVANNRAYLAWQDANKKFDANVTLDEMSRSMDISVAEFDGMAFTQKNSITNDNILDGEPKMATNGNEVAVVWSRNSENDPSGIVGTNSILRAVYTDAWGETSVIEEGLPFITEINTAYAGNEHVLTYGIDKDGDIGTLADREIVLIKGDKRIEVTNNDVEDLNPVLVQGDNGTDLYWYSTEKIMMINDLEEANINTVIEYAGGMSQFKILANGVNKVIYWEQPDGFSSDIYGLYYDHELQKWGEPIQLTNNGSKIRGTTGYLANDGSVNLTYNAVQVLTVESENDEPFGEVDLVITKISPDFNVAIASGIEFDKSLVEPGNTVPLGIYLTNNGQKAVEGLNLKILNAEDKIIQEETIDKILMSGESDYIDIDYKLPENLSQHQIKLMVTPLNNADRDLTDNTVSATLGQANISVAKPQVTGVGVNRKITAVIQNTGYGDSDELTVKLQVKKTTDSAGNETEEDGEAPVDEVLSTVTIESIPAQQSSMAEFQVNMNDFRFTTDSDDLLFTITAEGNEDEMNGQNSHFVTVGNPYDYDYLSISGIGLAGSTLIFNMYNNLPETVDSTLFVQAIENGNIISSFGQSISIDALYGQTMQLDISQLMETDSGDFLRVFVANEDGNTISNIVDLGDEKVGNPFVFPSPGTYKENQIITILSPTAGAEIYYTTDGSVPTPESMKYTLPINITKSVTIKAIAVKEGMATSDVAEFNYVINKSTGSAGEDTSSRDTTSGDTSLPTNQTSITMSKEELKKQLAENGKAVMATQYGQIELTNATLSDLKLKTGDLLTLTIKPAEGTNNNMLAQYNVTLMKGQTPITFLEGFNIKLSLKYEAKASGNPGTLVGATIDTTSRISYLPISKYNETTKEMNILINRLGLIGIMKNVIEFTDTVNHWTQESVAFLAAREIVHGIGNGKFNPKGLTTRAEFVKILASIKDTDLRKYTTTKFIDVPEGSWYSTSISWAAEKGIISGIGNGRFAPDRYITREEMAVMISKFAKEMDYQLTKSINSSTFADESQISTWAIDSVKEAQAAGIISGKTGNIFDPKANATRGETAKMIAELIRAVLGD